MKWDYKKSHKNEVAVIKIINNFIAGHPDLSEGDWSIIKVDRGFEIYNKGIVAATCYDNVLMPKNDCFEVGLLYETRKHFIPVNLKITYGKSYFNKALASLGFDILNDSTSGGCDIMFTSVSGLTYFLKLDSNLSHGKEKFLASLYEAYNKFDVNENANSWTVNGEGFGPAPKKYSDILDCTTFDKRFIYNVWDLFANSLA